MKSIIHAHWCARITGTSDECDCGSHQVIVDRKRKQRMESIDRQPPEIRALVHEYGWSTVNALMDVGVTKPRNIRHIVETILNEFSPTRSTYSSQGTNTYKIRELTKAKQVDLAD